MPSLPFFKTKPYLSGIDWIVHVFDYMNKRATGAGHMFQIVLELDGAPEKDELQQSLNQFIHKFPIVNGKTVRDYNLAPFWKIPSRAQGGSFPFKIYQLENHADIFPLLEQLANTPFSTDRDHIVFYLINTRGKSYVVAKFDHRLFDAHGAETFIGMFQQEWEEKGACNWKIPLFRSAHLSEWREKFGAGKQVNRAFLGLAENAPPRVLPLTHALSKQGFRFSVIPFNQKQSVEIMEKADDEAGYLMITPYTMAITVQILHDIFTKRGINKGDYVIPVTIDMRSQKTVAQEVFFNHVSFFLFRIQADEIDDFSILVEAIKKQMYDQVRSGLARRIQEASFLMRIVPLPLLSHLMRVYLKGQIASFCFSYLGETVNNLDRFMGKKVHHFYHMTRVPIPPGLGVFFHNTQGKLNVYLTYAKGLLNEDEVNSIVHEMESRLEV